MACGLRPPTQLECPGCRTRSIADWDASVARSKTAAEMRKAVLAQYPGLGMEFTLDGRVATYFPAQPAQGGAK